MQFLTVNMIPGEYEVEFQLQTPEGDEITSITDSLVIQEDLSKADLLGFEMLRTHRGKGADTYVQKNNGNDFGGNKKRNVYPMYTQYDWIRFYELDAEPLAQW